MDIQTYRKILRLIIIANLIFFGLSNYMLLLKIISYIIALFSPFILGGCIAFVLNIPMTFFEKKLFNHSKKPNVNRAVSILFTLLLFLLGIVVIISIIIPEIINSVNEVSSDFPDLINKLFAFFESKNINLKELLGYYMPNGFDINNFDPKIILSKISLNNTSGTLMSIFNATTTVFSSVLNFLLGFIFAMYILAGKENLGERTTKLIRKVFGEQKADKILDFANLVYKSFANFISGQGTEAIILAAMFFVTMMILGIPKALPSAAVIGVFSLVPIFGAFFGFLYSLLTIVIIEPTKAVWFIALFLVLQQVEGNLIYPRVVGKSVGLPGMWVLVAVTIGASVAGINGIIIGVPMASVIYTLVSNFIDKDKLIEKKPQENDDKAN